MSIFKHVPKVLVIAIAAASLGCNKASDTSTVPTSSAAEPASHADDGSNWERYGRTFKEDHFSPLQQINADNIDQLGLAWFHDLPQVPSSGATAPLAVDGILYFAVGHSVIHAMEAVTGKLLWQYDPKVYDVVGKELRGAWGVRGIAYTDGKIFSGTADGRLIAVDATSGQLVWSANTTEPNDGRYITGFPYVIGDKIIIGHGGADFGPVRGYVTAYEVDTGEQAWRFYTVPGNPADGFESPAMEMAAKTWTGEWWKHGGGGTAWHAMAYDPEFNQVYIGTGNGAPWNQKIRSPEGGDNLFLCSIIAVDADTGEYNWHYQVNPGETWDYNAAMDIQLAEITINEEPRKVILHAPKNGFFYVIDRTSGKLISAEPFARQNWAERIDTKSGRPVELPAARYPDGTAYALTPNAFGAHGVEAMSYNPNTGLVYLPARNKGSVYTDAPNLDQWRFNNQVFLDSGTGTPPAGMQAPPSNGWLAAWDPVQQKEVWRVDMEDTHNGGTLTTAGNLLVQGRSTGELSIYAADSGRKIWDFDAQYGIMAQPITYSVDGKQYITQLVGWRGSTWSGKGKRWNYRNQRPRVLTFALDAKQQLPEIKDATTAILDAPGFVIDEQKAALGSTLYHSTCTICHGAGLMAGGAAPDLLRSAFPMTLKGLTSVLSEGALLQRGMPPYPDLSSEQIEHLQHYIRQTAREELKKNH